MEFSFLWHKNGSGYGNYKYGTITVIPSSRYRTSVSFVRVQMQFCTASSHIPYWSLVWVLLRSMPAVIWERIRRPNAEDYFRRGYQRAKALA